MKKIFISMTITAILIAGCSGSQTNEHEQNDGTHQHDDGSIHLDHGEDTAVKQEEFAAPPDTASQNKESKHTHTHDVNDGHAH